MTEFEYTPEWQLRFLKDIHEMCGYCNGSGRIMGYNGPEDCKQIDMHVAVSNVVGQALEGLGEYKAIRQANVELMTAQVDFTTRIGTMSKQLQDIATEARKAGEALDWVIDMVYNPPEGSTLDELRASIIIESVYDLHYAMDGTPDRCVCGETWDPSSLCSEARRIIAYAEGINNKENDQ